MDRSDDRFASAAGYQKIIHRYPAGSRSGRYYHVFCILRCAGKFAGIMLKSIQTAVTDIPGTAELSFRCTGILTR